MYNWLMKSSQLWIAGIFFALGFLVAYFRGSALLPNFDMGKTVDGDTKIILEYPEPNSVVSSPLQVKAKVRGNWFFEGSLPMELQTTDGKRLATGVGQAKGEWMTSEFVDFEGSLVFLSGGATEGLLIIKKDNPSGLSENDDQVEIPVKFK